MNQANRNISRTRTTPCSVVILAAGMGERMSSYGPKALLPFKSEKILDRQIRLVQETINPKEIIVVVGFQKEKIYKHLNNTDIQIVENNLYKQNNVSVSLNIGLQAATCKKVVVIYGDLIFDKNSISFPIGANSCLPTSKIMNDQEVGLLTKNHKLVKMSYGLDAKWSQIMYLTGHELLKTKIITSDRQNDMDFGFEIINKVLENHGEFQTGYTGNYVDIDYYNDLEKAEKLL